MSHTKFWQIAHKSRRSALITALGVVMVLIALSYASIMLAELDSEIEALESRVASYEGDMKQLESRYEEQRRKATAAEQQLAGRDEQIAGLKTQVVADLGHKELGKLDDVALERSLTARRLADKLASSGLDRRAGVKVRYYPADFERHVNPYIVLSQFAAYGFQLEKGSGRIASIPLNTVWCGAKVHADDVRLVVLTLIAAGVEVKAVRQLQTSEGANAQLIEIGVNSALEAAPALSAEAVMAMTTFKRQH